MERMPMKTLHGWVLAVAVVIVCLGGCASGSRGALDRAILDYEAGRFEEARQRAWNARSGPADVRDEATYVAGLSAFRIGDLDQAAARLRMSADSTHPIVAGRSKAALGLVRLEQNRPREAAAFLVDASKLLSGREGADAAHFAGVAYQEAGDYNAAQQQFRDATELYATVGRVGTDTGRAGSFVIQVGAFQSLENARDAQGQVQQLASSHNLDPPRVIARTDTRARTLYLVQFGSFNTREAAERARTRIGRLDFIVAPRAVALAGD